ncbi:hypothetical protein NDA13_000574 [Ustilago tritici]|nr:hypothetical protein NDA13_000574 [Ustilago tritici]
MSRKRKIKCSGERPWCSNCKGKNKPCVYDTGTIRIKKQEEDVLQAARREAGALALPGTSRSYTLYSELNSLYNRLWEQTRGYWAKQNATLGDGSRPQITAINAVKTLPFGDQLQVPSIGLCAGQSDQPGRYADTFTPVSIRILSGDGTFGKARLLQLIDLAFNSHPFLSAIVSRTLFLEDIEDETYDRQLFDCILIAALGLREHFAGAVGARACTEELPEIEDLIPKTTDILNRVKLGTLNASKMHVSIQCMMLLAWHELAQGFLK